jgi:hypothetical protein
VKGRIKKMRGGEEERENKMRRCTQGRTGVGYMGEKIGG